MALQQRTVKRLFSAAFQIRTYSALVDRSIPAAKQKYVPTEGTYPKGFLAGAAHAGVKASNTKHDDIALVVSETPCQATAVFTRNKFQAAPITVSRRSLAGEGSKRIKGVVVNSGCANAITGQKGLENATQMALTADTCSEGGEDPKPPRENPNKAPQTLVMSTGVIGQQLPIEKVTAAIPKAHAALGSTHEHWLAAAKAICTTDTFPKLLTRTFTLPSHPQTEYRLAGMTKGAGMIHPNMATLLGIICTDARLDETGLHVLRVATAASFNSISIDGDTSTNDTVALLASGAAAPETQPALTFPTGRNSPWNADSLVFLKTLRSFMRALAHLVVRDGEGATKFVTVRVRSDVSKVTANRVAKSIATSNLVKTALYGKDANWGRILCAIGYSPGITDDSHAAIPGPQLSLERTSVSFVPADGSAELQLLVRGEPQEVDEGRAGEILAMEDLQIFVKLDDYGDGEGKAEDEESKVRQSFESLFWTCDFSHEYVTINGDYRT